MKILETRRGFLTRLGMTGAAVGASPLFRAVAGTFASLKPNLKVGILSDIHVYFEHLAECIAPLKRAFEYFRDNGADAVLIAGDMADSSRVVELETVGQTWREVFPGDKAPDGRKVEKLFLYGNHDARWDWPKDAGSDLIAFDRAAVWEKCFDEAYKPIYVKVVKGYTFICLHWPVPINDQAVSTGLAELMAVLGPKLRGEKPFFFAQHPHPKDTCSGPWAWGHDVGESTKILSEYPNAVAFSGHSHYPLTDERVVWQGAFTSIGTSSLKYSSCDYLYRENMPKGNGKDPRPRRMERLRADDGKQGMLMSVYDDCLVLERREFVNGKSLGDDWVVPIPAPAVGASPFDFGRRAAARFAPEFAADAKVDVQADVPNEKWIVTWTGAETKGKCRAFEYEVTAYAVGADVEFVAAQRRVLAKDFYLPEGERPPRGECHFAWCDLPGTMQLRFEVRPLECFGKKGKAISSGTVQYPEKKVEKSLSENGGEIS
jgi:predicted phosphodiesterase